MVVSCQGGLPSGRSPIRIDSPGWSSIRVVFLREISHQGGLSPGWLSSEWSPIRVVSHQGGLPSGWSFIRVIFHEGGLLSGWSVIRVVSHQGGLPVIKEFPCNKSCN